MGIESQGVSTGGGGLSWASGVKGVLEGEGSFRGVALWRGHVHCLLYKGGTTKWGLGRGGAGRRDGSMPPAPVSAGGGWGHKAAAGSSVQVMGSGGYGRCEHDTKRTQVGGQSCPEDSRGWYGAPLHCPDIDGWGPKGAELWFGVVGRARPRLRLRAPPGSQGQGAPLKKKEERLWK